MKLHEVKKGVKVVLTGEVPLCQAISDVDYAYVVAGGGDGARYSVYNSDGEMVGSCWDCFDNVEVELYDDAKFKVGDIIISGRYYRRIIDISEGHYGVSNFEGTASGAASAGPGTYMSVPYVEGNYTLHEEPKEVELTLSDIAEKFGIGVEQVRIKEWYMAQFYKISKVFQSTDKETKEPILDQYGNTKWMFQVEGQGPEGWMQVAKKAGTELHVGDYVYGIVDTWPEGKAKFVRQNPPEGTEFPKNNSAPKASAPQQRQSSPQSSGKIEAKLDYIISLLENNAQFQGNGQTPSNSSDFSPEDIDPSGPSLEDLDY